MRVVGFFSVYPITVQKWDVPILDLTPNLLTAENHSFLNAVMETSLAARNPGKIPAARLGKRQWARNRAALTILNIVMFPPMAKATVRTTVDVNSGVLRIMRAA